MKRKALTRLRILLSFFRFVLQRMEAAPGETRRAATSTIGEAD